MVWDQPPGLDASSAAALKSRDMLGGPALARFLI